MLSEKETRGPLFHVASTTYSLLRFAGSPYLGLKSVREILLNPNPKRPGSQDDSTLWLRQANPGFGTIKCLTTSARAVRRKGLFKNLAGGPGKTVSNSRSRNLTRDNARSFILILDSGTVSKFKIAIEENIASTIAIRRGWSTSAGLRIARLHPQ